MTAPAPAKRPRPVEQQNDRTIELRRLADDAEDAEWLDEEPTKPGAELPPPRKTLSSVHDAPPESVPAPTKSALAILYALPLWARLPALLAILAFIAFLITHGRWPW